MNRDISSERVLESLEKSSELRNSKDIMIISNLLSEIPFFSRISSKNANVLSFVAKYVRVKRIQKGEVLYKENEECNGFYFTYEGSILLCQEINELFDTPKHKRISLLKTSSEKRASLEKFSELSNFRANYRSPGSIRNSMSPSRLKFSIMSNFTIHSLNVSEIKDKSYFYDDGKIKVNFGEPLEKGRIFGESEAEKNIPRTSTALALKDSILLFFNTKGQKGLFNELQGAKLEKKKEFLKESIFKDTIVREDFLLRIISQWEKKTFSFNSYLFLQGDFSEGIFLIYKGFVEVFRLVESDNDENLTRVNVSMRERGRIVGDDDVDDDTRSLNAVAASEIVKAFFISKELLKRIFLESKEFENNFNSKIKLKRFLSEKLINLRKSPMTKEQNVSVEKVSVDVLEKFDDRALPSNFPRFLDNCRIRSAKKEKLASASLVEFFTNTKVKKENPFFMSAFLNNDSTIKYINKRAAFKKNVKPENTSAKSRKIIAEMYNRLQLPFPQKKKATNTKPSFFPTSIEESKSKKRRPFSAAVFSIPNEYLIRSKPSTPSLTIKSLFSPYQSTSSKKKNYSLSSALETTQSEGKNLRNFFRGKKLEVKRAYSAKKVKSVNLMYS